MKQLFLFCCMLLQYTMNAQTYYDLDNNEIDKATFEDLEKSKKIYSVSNDSLKIFKLMSINKSYETGSLDSKELINDLNQKLNLKIETTKPLIIYYYPGKDPCNSGGRYSVRSENLKWNKQLSRKVRKIADVTVLRIYKNKEGLVTFKDYDWKKDPNKLIENNFFRYDYGCEGFIIIDKDEYYFGFGEYGPEAITNGLKEILKK